MNLQKLIFTENACYKAGKKIKPKGVMVHSTGANNPNLKRYVGPDDGKLGKNIYNNHWNNFHPSGREVCVHAFIGKLKDGSIATYQTLPWDHRGWHAGGSANSTHISFEICEDNLKDATYFNKVYTEAAELTAMLCKMYNLDPMAPGVVICHSEGYKRGIASNHGDVMHWFPKHGKSMDTFRADVKALMGGDNVQKPVETVKKEVCNVSIPILQKGVKGSSVKAMQLLLIHNGYNCGSTGADGDFGKNTLNAVMKFQSNYGLTVDGICGSKTWSKLLGI